MAADPRDVARRARWRKWFWLANYALVPLVAARIVPPEWAIAYLTFLSVQALVEAASATEQGAESRFPEDD